MAALTAERNTRTKATAAVRTNSGGVAAATTIWLGALIAVNAAGFIVPASDTAALKVVGIANETVVNAGAAGAKSVVYQTGLVVELENAGGAIVQASMHRTCVVADDQSVTTAAVATNDIVAGVVQGFTSTKVWVYVDEAGVA